MPTSAVSPERRTALDTRAPPRAIWSACYTASMSWLDEVKWDAQGLLPVIAQEVGSGDVLMFAWMNREALAQTAVRACQARCVAPLKPRSPASQLSTGSVPGSTGLTSTGSVCHAIAWPSRISNSPLQANTLQKCSRTSACG